MTQLKNQKSNIKRYGLCNISSGGETWEQMKTANDYRDEKIDGYKQHWRNVVDGVGGFKAGFDAAMAYRDERVENIINKSLEFLKGRLMNDPAISRIEGEVDSFMEIYENKLRSLAEYEDLK